MYDSHKRLADWLVGWSINCSIQFNWIGLHRMPARVWLSFRNIFFTAGSNQKSMRLAVIVAVVLNLDAFVVNKDDDAHWRKTNQKGDKQKMPNNKKKKKKKKARKKKKRPRTDQHHESRPSLVADWDFHSGRITFPRRKLIGSNDTCVHTPLSNCVAGRPRNCDDVAMPMLSSTTKTRESVVLLCLYVLGVL